MIKLKDSLWQLVVVFISLIATLVQLKLSTNFLNSYELGIIALASIPLLLANVISDFGIANYIIHRRDISISELSAIYGLAFVLGVTACIILVILGAILAFIYTDYAVLSVTAVCIPVVVLSCITSVPYAVANSAMEFKIISLSDVLSKIVLIVCLILFFYWRLGIYAIAVAQAFSCLFKLIYLLKWSFKYNFLPELKLCFNLSMAKKAIPFGLSQFGSQFLNIIGQKLDELILGKCLGVSELGIYSVIKQLLIAANGFISAPARRLLMPVFSRGVNCNLFINIYFKYLVVLSCIFGVFIVLPFIPAYVLKTIHGHELEMAVLSLAWMLRISSGNLQSAYMVSTGRPAVEFHWNIVQTLFLSLVLIASSFYLQTLLQYSSVMLASNIALILISSLFFPVTRNKAISVFCINLLIALAFLIFIYFR
ncbi:TPA: oligosaccharide flippase family protein [Citrobacter sedlakii]